MTLRIGVLKKWLASRVSYSLSLSRLLYISPSSNSLVLHLGIEEWRLPQYWASESASDVPSCMRCAAAARQTVCYMSGMT
jgi:hypothetical protein